MANATTHLTGRTKRTPKAISDFLAKLEEGSTVSAAAAAVNIGRRTAYEWRADDTAFANAWDEAVEVGTDLLEDEAKRRAADGYDEPVFWQGKQVGVVRKYSDRLLQVMLKARRPEKFKDRFENTGPGGGPIQIEDVSLLTDTERQQRINAILEGARARKQED